MTQLQSRSIEIQNSGSTYWLQVPFSIDPGGALRKLRSLEQCLLFESSVHDQQLGRFSYLMADPVEIFSESSLGETPAQANRNSMPEMFLRLRERLRLLLARLDRRQQ